MQILIIDDNFSIIKEEGKAKIRIWYNQVSHLTWDTMWEIANTQENAKHMRAMRTAFSQQVITRLDSIIKTNMKYK